MPTTRRQAAIQEQEQQGEQKRENEGEQIQDETIQQAGDKRHVEQATKSGESSADEPLAKKVKLAAEDGKGRDKLKDHTFQSGTIERGHIYFFYRPRVQMEEAHALEDVKNLHMLLIPRPPEFSVHDASNDKTSGDDEEMAVLASGADAVPAPEMLDQSHKRYRLVVIGKKKLPDPDQGGAGKGRKETFWATVVAIGNDLQSLEKGLGEKTYETKTRGVRHQEPARLAARGAYAIVNNEPRIPSERATHLGYHISHPSELGDVQASLGISIASSFVLQVKNPLAPAISPQQSHAKSPDYPDHIMQGVFGRGTKGRESYGLRFASCETPELLDYEGAQLLLIASKGDEPGLEESLGKGRGTALQEAVEKEGHSSVQHVFRELDMDGKVFPADPLEGHWI